MVAEAKSGMGANRPVESAQPPTASRLAYRTVNVVNWRIPDPSGRAGPKFPNDLSAHHIHVGCAVPPAAKAERPKWHAYTLAAPRVARGLT